MVYFKRDSEWQEVHRVYRQQYGGNNDQMMAWILHENGRLCFETTEKPVQGEGEVLIRVKAVGVCGSDIPRIYRGGAYFYPLIPGHEFAGVVAETGADVDEGLRGRRVGVFPLIPCGVCGPCRKKQYEMCRNYSYTGSRRNGAFAEYVAVPAKNLIALPEEVSFEEAAMLEPMAVAVHAMRRIQPAAQDTAVVCGLGTIGLFLLMFLKEAGVERILAIGNKELQKQMAGKLGLPEGDYCDSRRQDAVEWLMERTGGCGADLFFECVGKNETYAQAVRAAAPSGKIMLVGNPASDMALPRDVYWRILRNQLTVMGTWNSSFLHEPEDDWNYVLGRLAKKRITPADMITHRFALEGLEQGFHMMRDKTEDYVKVMVAV